MNVIFSQMIALFLLSIIASISGSLLLWRRSTFLLDAIAHASIFSFAIIELLHLPEFIAFICFAMFFAGVITYFEKTTKHSMGTIIFLTGNFLLITGLTLMSMKFKNLDECYLEDIFLGNINNITSQKIYFLVAVTILILTSLKIFWRKIMGFIIDKDFFQIQGNNYYKFIYCFFFLMILVITIALKLIGAFLVISIFLIPVTIATIITNSPLKIMIYAFLIINIININSLMVDQYLKMDSMNLLSGVMSFILLFLMQIIQKIRSMRENRSNVTT